MDGTERRAFPRLDVLDDLHGHLVPFGMPVTIREVSVGGFSAETVVPFRASSRHTVRFTTDDGQEIVIEADVVHCQPVPGSGGRRYVTGFTFVSDAAGEWMQKVFALLDAVSSPPEPLATTSD